MQHVIVRFMRVCKYAQVAAAAPERMTYGASGFDLRSIHQASIEIKPGKFARIGTGLALAIPEGLEGQIRSRSGLAARHGVAVLNSPGTIDADYHGEIFVVLVNHGEETFIVRPGDRIAQLVFAPVVIPGFRLVPELEDTSRGQGGFGSTGV
jgi:dUTP pyrophosphatase